MLCPAVESDEVNQRALQTSESGFEGLILSVLEVGVELLGSEIYHDIMLEIS